MELKFNKNGDAWVAEFEATDKFNLHMEGLLLGSFSILQRTAGGKYTHVRDIPTYPRFDKVFDYDFDALVYPKYIKIVSETEPTYAEVVSDGEITEIKSQTKEVEVTANGTTQVAPDAGYSYLTGVTVKTNVPQSGGSGGTEASSMEYLDVSGVGTSMRAMLLAYSLYAKVPQKTIIDTSTDTSQGTVIIDAGIVTSSVYALIVGKFSSGTPNFDTANQAITALGFDFGGQINIEGQILTLNDMFAMFGMQEAIDAIPRLTKEEFYTI